MKKNDRVEVEWLDVVDDSSWLSENDAGKISPEAYCKSMGYFLKQDNKYLWISPSISARKKKGQRSSTMIPNGVITKIRKLRVDRK